MKLSLEGSTITNQTLSGLKILDLSRVLAGPLCGQILGDLGADVIKIERPKLGDDTRHWGPPDFEGMSAYFLSANRNKRSVALDMKKKEDLDRLHELASEADVVIENFKTGALKKFRLDYESLIQKNPRLIYCSITGYGQTGPLAHKPGYDAVIQAVGGLMSVTGPDSNTPTKVGVAVSDIMTGLYAAIGILGAVYERERSGKGQQLDLSILDVQLSALSYLAMNYLCTGTAPKSFGNAHPTIVPYQTFQTKDGSLMICIGNDHQFKTFSEAVGEKWHEDSRFKTNESRLEFREKLIETISQKLKSQPNAHWMEIFDPLDFPFGPIRNIAEVAKDPQVKFRKLFTTMEDGKTPCIKNPIEFSRTPVKTYRKPPKLNEHSEARFKDSK